MIESAAEATLKLYRKHMCISKHDYAEETLCILGTAKIKVSYSELQLAAGVCCGPTLMGRDWLRSYQVM